jgi:hypothetical protein
MEQPGIAPGYSTLAHAGHPPPGDWISYILAHSYQKVNTYYVILGRVYGQAVEVQWSMYSVWHFDLYASVIDRPTIHQASSPDVDQP